MPGICIPEVVSLFPPAFERRERALLGARFDGLYRYAAPAPARGLTFNALRGDPALLAAACGLPLTPSPFAPGAYILADADARPGRHPCHHAGAFYVQEPSAAAPAALLEVRPGLRVADLCAAPGGKTAQLAAAMRGRGFLLANEWDAARAAVLRQNLERLGVTNAVVTNADTAALAAALPGAFDRVLVDAPCSGEGMFRKEPAAAAQYGQPLVEHCAALGAAILDSAAALLAPGGLLVYSTCTFSPEEDEAQVLAFLARHPAFSLCDLSAAGFGRPGEPNRAGDDARAACCRRIWPADGGEGHFIARLQKRPDAPAPGRRPPGPARAKPCPAWQAFAKQLFPALAAEPALQRGEQVFLPAPGAPALPGVRVLRAGVPAGRLLTGHGGARFEPAHALFMAYGARCANQERLALHDPRTDAWLRGEEIEAATAAPGWCAVLVDGLPLGFGKMSGGRIKNHYPKGLRSL